MTPEEWFWSRVDKSTACWIWTGQLDRDGYGKFRNRAAHRQAWSLSGRPLPVWPLQFDHLCRVRNCVNPDHLEVVTPRENKIRSLPFQVQTHCVNGHLFNEGNTYRRLEGQRGCRRCIADRVRRYRARQKGAAA